MLDQGRRGPETQGTPYLRDPVTYQHIWGVAGVAPTCKQTAVNSAQGALSSCQVDLAP